MKIFLNNRNPSQAEIDYGYEWMIINRYTGKVTNYPDLDTDIGGVGDSISNTPQVTDILSLKKSLNELTNSNEQLNQKIDQIQGTSDSGNMITLIKEMALQQQMFTSVALELNEKIEALSKVILSLH